MKIYFAIFVFTLFFSFASYADDVSEWAEDRVRLDKFIEEGRCSEYWNIIWPWAKKGNAEARFNLLFRTVGFMHMDQILLPGSGDDYVSRMRNWTIMAVYAQEYYHNMPSNIPNHDFLLEYRQAMIKIFELAGFREAQGGDEFLSCVEARGGNCSAIAIKNKLVPSFEEYAAQIDAFMVQGMQSRCKEDQKSRQYKDLKYRN